MTTVDTTRLERSRSLDVLQSDHFDVVVIGGGITGAGVALDAASRGLRVALIERRDFASGTSSRSSKLIHGGLRYLKQFQVGVTYEALRERERLLRLAPHLVRPLPFILPHRLSRLSSLTYAVGLQVYDTFAGLDAGRRHRHLSRKELLQRVPLLDVSAVGGAYEYFDATADDCRLVMHVLRTAALFGATLANYVEAVRLHRDRSGRVSGVESRDILSGETIVSRCDVVVNACGVWCDDVRRAFDGDAPPLLRPSKGIHLVLDNKRLPLRGAVAIASTAAGQHLFLLPWGHRTLVGTTDTDYHGDLDHPRASLADLNLLLGILGDAFPRARITRDDVISVYAGLRPLLSGRGDKALKAARDYSIEARNGVVTVTGGKLTTYRRMTERVVDGLAPSVKCRTAEIGLFRTDDPPPDSLIGRHLHSAFGSDAPVIAAMPNSNVLLAPDLPYTVAEVDYVILHEMAMTVSDVLLRRTRLALTDFGRGLNAASIVADRLAAHHGWSVEQRERSVRAFAEDVADFAVPTGDPPQITSSLERSIEYTKETGLPASTERKAS